MAQRLRAQLLFALLLVPACVAFGALPETKDFARLAEFSEVVISPDGDYLAVNVVNDQRRDLAVIRLQDMQVVLNISPGAGEHVFNLHWASSTRILVELATSGRFRAEPVPTGELMAIDRDGSNGRYLFGARGVMPDGDYMADKTRRARFASIVQPMLANQDYALIQSWSFYVRPEDRYSLVERINLHDGRSHWATQAPLPGVVAVVADSAGEVRYVQGKAEKPGLLQTLVRDPKTDSWEKLESGDPLADFSPLTISDDGLTGYLKVREGNDRFCLERHNLENGQRQQLACHPQADLSGVVTSPLSGHVVGAVFDPGKPQVRWLATQQPDVKLLQRVWKQFPEAQVRITSHSRDGNRWVLRVDSDTNPGEFYLFDRQKQELRFLLARHHWIKPEQMPKRTVFHWAAADGREITGYLTHPRHLPAENLPLIVMAHGGPFDVRDTWAWQPLPAFLASRGYLVLQPQFRGSAGMGREFRDAGRQVMGTAMVDDLSTGERRPGRCQAHWGDGAQCRRESGHDGCCTLAGTFPRCRGHLWWVQSAAATAGVARTE